MAGIGKTTNLGAVSSFIALGDESSLFLKNIKSRGWSEIFVDFLHIFIAPSIHLDINVILS